MQTGGASSPNLLVSLREMGAVDGRTIIYLGLRLPAGSSDYPEARRAAAEPPRRALMLPYQSCTRWGLQRGPVARPRVSSYLAFPPLRPAEAGFADYLCCTFLEVAFTGS